MRTRQTAFAGLLELMPHIKGNWGNPLIVLAPWQVFMLTTIFGWIKY